MIDAIRDYFRASILEQSSIIGKMRYYFLDRYYRRTLYVSLIGVCFLVTLLSTLLLRESAVTGNFLKGLIPVAGMFGVIAFLFVYTNLELTGVLIFVVSLVLADGVGTGTGTKITFTFLGLNLWAASWLFKMIIIDREFKLRPSIVNRTIPIFQFVVLLSFIWGIFFVDVPVSYLYNEKIFPRLMTMIVLTISPLTVLMVGNTIRSVRTLKFMVWFYIACGVVFGILRLATSTVPKPLNANGQFPTWIGAFAVGQLLFNRNLGWRMRILLAVTIGVWFYIQIGLGLSWLSGWIPLMMVIALALTIFSRKALVVAILVVLAYIALNYSGLQANFAREDEESGGTRQAAWSEALKVADKHLLLGTGPAGYAFYYMTYGFHANFSHNNYVDIIAQLGVVGMTAFMTMWLSMGWMTYKMYRTVPNDHGFMQGLKIALLVSWPTTMVVMMLGDWITPFTYTQGLGGIDYAIWSWIAPGMALALYHLAGQHAPTTVSQTAPALPPPATPHLLPESVPPIPSAPIGALSQPTSGD